MCVLAFELRSVPVTGAASSGFADAASAMC